jgi:low temperature requirement protein LtrA
MVALGESILTTGASLSHSVEWGAPTLLALLVAFAGSLGMWWLYFDTGSKDGTQAIVHSSDPGRVGAYFHYIHVTLIAGIIVWAVGTELIIAEPDGRIDLPAVCVLIGGPLTIWRATPLTKVVYGRIPLSHLAGAATLVILFPLHSSPIDCW